MTTTEPQPTTARNPRNNYITHLLYSTESAGPNSLGAETNIQWAKAATDEARRAGKPWIVVQDPRGAIAIAKEGAIHHSDEIIHPEKSADL